MLTVLGLGAFGTLFGSNIQNGITSVLDSLHAQGIAAALPGGGQFTIYTITDGYPAAPADYKLRVGGLVERPLALSVSDLQSLPATRLTRDFQCVTGWVVSNVHWVGVRLTDLADHAGVSPAARAFRFTSFDGAYTEGLTMDQARETGAIVAYSMLGAPVTREHGGPVASTCLACTATSRSSGSRGSSSSRRRHPATGSRTATPRTPGSTGSRRRTLSEGPGS